MLCFFYVWIMIFETRIDRCWAHKKASLYTATLKLQSNSRVRKSKSIKSNGLLNRFVFSKDFTAFGLRRISNKKNVKNFLRLLLFSTLSASAPTTKSASILENFQIIKLNVDFYDFYNFLFVCKRRLEEGAPRWRRKSWRIQIII